MKVTKVTTSESQGGGFYHTDKGAYWFDPITPFQVEIGDMSLEEYFAETNENELVEFSYEGEPLPDDLVDVSDQYASIID